MKLFYSAEGVRRYLETEFDCKPYRPEHSEGVFTETILRITYRSDYSVFKVLKPSEIVNNAVLPDVVRQSIDGEIPSRHIVS